MPAGLVAWHGRAGSIAKIIRIFCYCGGIAALIPAAMIRPWGMFTHSCRRNNKGVEN